MIDDFATLTSLAILKTDLDEGVRDYVGYLESFVLHVLKKHLPDPVTDEKIAELLLQDFGLNIPRKGCQLVLRRVAKRGYLKKEKGLFVVCSELPDVDFTEKKDAAHKEVAAVYTALIAFAKNNFGVAWSEKDVARALLAFLAQFGVDFLRAYVFKSALPHIPDGAPQDQYIIGKFVKALKSASHPLFESVAVLVKGQMYSNALVCPDLESLEKKFDKLTVYVDTPLVLDYFGLQGEENKVTARELIGLVRKLKGTTAIFEHTVDEIKAVLLASELNIDNPSADGKVIREVRQSGYKKSDLILLRENLKERLVDSKFSVKSTPRYVAEYQISEEQIEGILKEKVRYRSPEAIRHDVNSVRSIYVLRSGKVPRRLEDAVAVFVTTNSSFASAAFELGKDHNSTKEVSSVITDYSLANVAWLKAPLGAPELPSKELIAACYAALEPSYSLWSKYLRQIDSLRDQGTISPDDHALLRVSPLAATELMNLTLGDDAAFGGGSVRIILERVKEELVKEKEAEKRKAVEEKERAIEGKEAELALERAARGALAADHDRLVTGRDQAKSNIWWLTGRIAGACCACVRVAFVSVLVAAAFGASFLTKPYVRDSKALATLLNLCVLLGATWGLINWYCGLSVRDAVSALEKAVHSRLHKSMMKRIMEAPTSTEG